MTGTLKKFHRVSIFIITAVIAIIFVIEDTELVVKDATLEDTANYVADVADGLTQVVSQTNLHEVVRVIDGDTLIVRMNEREERVRLIGVNTPESVDPRKKVECFGKEATAYTEHLLDGRRVFIETDLTQSKYDKYGRLLAYVYREDGLFVNKNIIEEGYAYEYTYRVPYKYQNEFKQAQKNSESAKKGLWGDVCSQRELSIWELSS